MQINPNEPIVIAYLLSDPSDAGTYYARAVMRDTGSGKTLASLNLTNDGSNTRRFTGVMAAPGHNGASALWVDITITLYTDAGYSVIATNYPEIVTSYMIAYRWSQAMGGGGSGDPFQALDPAVIVEALIAAIKPEFKRLRPRAQEQIEQAAPDLTGLRSGLLEDFKEHLKERDQIRRSIDRKDRKRKHKREKIRKIAEGMRKLEEQKEKDTAIPSPIRFDLPRLYVERDLEEAFSSPTPIEGQRRPSEGVVSHLAVARNEMAFKKKKK